MKKYHMILPELSQRLIWTPLRVFMMIFCDLEVRGTTNLGLVKKNMIIASSHQSELDPLLIVACLPFFSRLFPIIYVTREKQFYGGQNWKTWQKILYGGRFFRIIGGYQSYVGLKNYKLALPHHLATLKIGNNVGIFPSGRRIKVKGEKVKVRGGVSFLAQQSKAPIVPVLIEGLEDLNLRNALSRKMKVKVTFGNPFYLKEIVEKNQKFIVSDKKNDYEIASEKIWQRIKNLAVEL